MSEAKTNIGEKRYYGSMPCIGIRPTIDGRRGVLKVRESLEEQTMNMAKSAAKLFEENLRYADGTPICTQELCPSPQQKRSMDL